MSDNIVTRAAPLIGEAGYQRIANDLYRTPAWVTNLLLDHETFSGTVWEPACGMGDMFEAIEHRVPSVLTSDLYDHGFIKPFHPWDFLNLPPLPGDEFSIITNPPYEKAAEFINRAIEFTAMTGGKVAMLLGYEFDAPKKHRPFFTCQAFARKIVLPKRIRWVGFEDKASPRQVHAWYVWDWQHTGSPTIRYVA